jgi:hypothetical protein
MAFHHDGSNTVKVRAAAPVSLGGGGSWPGWSTFWTTSNFNPADKISLGGETWNSSASDSPWNGGIQIREAQLVANTQSSWSYAPKITFHWGLSDVSALGFRGGWFEFANDLTNYRSVRARDISLQHSGRLYGSGAGAYSYGALTIQGIKNGWGGVEFNNGSSHCYTLMARDDGYGGPYREGGIGWLLQWDGSGNFTASGNVTAYSDERLKTDFAPARLSLDQMVWLQAEEFTRTDNGMRQVGVRAQALRRVIPLAVMESESGMLSVDYGKAALVTVLNLAREVAILKAQMEAS